MNSYDKMIIKDSKTIEELATRICGYGYYDMEGTEKRIIERYIEIGVKWSKEHGYIY